MEENSKLKLVYEEAYNYLKNKVGNEILRQNIDYYIEYKPESLNDIFEQMLESLKNRQGFSNFISPVSEMKDILFNFDPKEVFKVYGDNYKELFQCFTKRFGNIYYMDINNKKNSWVIYSKGVLDCAKFLANFDSEKDFDTFVKSFSHYEFTIVALPMLLEAEIFGYGFPLACDFLKEIGYVEYGKPDVHLKDIFYELGLVDEKNDYKVFKAIVKIGKAVNEKPVIVDKVFWLIGSGNFHVNNIKIGSQKAEFVAHVKKKLETSEYNKWW